MTRLVERIYGMLLYFYPPDLRRAHAEEMLQCARTALAARGAAAILRLFADLCFTIPREWLGLLKGLPMIGIGRDVAYAIRLLWRSPGFTLAAVLTLALGIGANTAIFTLADATLLHTIRVQDSQQLYMFKWSSSYVDYVEYAKRTDLFTGVLASAGMGKATVNAGGSGEAATAMLVSGNYFSVLGVPAAAGRVLTPPDDVRNGPIAAVLGYRWWRSRFGRDPSIVGRTIRVNGMPVTIVGVAREGFDGTSLYTPPQLFLPLNSAQRVRTGFFATAPVFERADMVWMGVVGRLRPGVSAAAATAAIDAMDARLHPPKAGARFESNELTPLRERAMGGDNAVSVHRFVVLLGSVVALTLLIACANLANLMLARSAARRREIGIRMAIGAGRARVARQLLIESLILAAGGGAAGLYVATITLKLIARFQLPGGIDIENLPLDLNRTALLFTLGLSTLTGMLFGLAPAWRAGRLDVMASLRMDARTASGPSRLRSALVAAQVALSLVLLAGTGLFLRSLANVLDTHLGFRTEGVATATVNLGTARYDAARAKPFYDDALGRVRTVPGVTSAAWTNVIPITGLRMFTPDIEGYTKQGPQDSTTFYNAAVGPEYFQAAGTRLVSGRAFTADDTAAAPHVAIVNEEAVRRFWRDRDPLQGRLRLRLPRQQGEDIIQVVGVVENTTVRELNEQVKPYVYLPFAQSEGGAPLDAVHLFVRTNGDPAPLLPQIQAQLRAVDPAAPVLTLATFEWQIRQLVMPQRMGATLFGVFAGLALLLAAVGIYGVASYVTALRAREIGIRIALGADRTRIRALVMRQGAAPIAAGIAAGLLLAVLGGRLAQAFLRGVTSRDPLTYAAVVAVLGAVALAATWVPARRAAALDPIQALRQD